MRVFEFSVRVCICMHYARSRMRTRRNIVQSYKYYRNYRPFSAKRASKERKYPHLQHFSRIFCLRPIFLLYLHSNGFLSQEGIKREFGESPKQYSLL